MLAIRTIPFCLLLVGLSPTASAEIWTHATPTTIGDTGEWTNKCELADLDGDGDVDLLLANGRGYASADGGERNRAFFNPSSPDASWKDMSASIFGNTTDQTRAIKVRDFNGDGNVDIFVANSFQTQSLLYMGAGDGTYVLAPESIPQENFSFGDVEPGDVDGDGDLDLVLADWGPGNALSNDGGRTRLWLNNGLGKFTDVTSNQMPDLLVRFSWELELADVDNDLDLDALVSCKSCSGSTLFHNDGNGNFAWVEDGLPQYSNNYDFELMDITGDGFLDVVTINDGPNLREHLFVNTGQGTFVDETDIRWPEIFNVGEDDNAARFLDVDSDGDSDIVIGSLSGKDRLITLQQGAVIGVTDLNAGPNTPGTLDLQFGYLTEDAQLDWVQAQGEVGNETDHIYFGDDIAEDTSPPHISLVVQTGDLESNLLRVRARIHDGRTPWANYDWQSVQVSWAEVDKDPESIPMTWYGEHLWNANIKAEGPGTFQVCATDRAGNTACTEFEAFPAEEVPPDPDVTEPSDSAEPDTSDSSNAEDADEEDGSIEEEEDASTDAEDNLPDAMSQDIELDTHKAPDSNVLPDVQAVDPIEPLSDDENLAVAPTLGIKSSDGCQSNPSGDCFPGFLFLILMGVGYASARGRMA